LTSQSGQPHWELSAPPGPRPPPRLNGVAPHPVVRRFLRSLDNYVSPEGDRPGGRWQVTTSDPNRAKPLLGELRAGVTGIVKRELGKSFDAKFLDRANATLDLAVKKHAEGQPRVVSIRTMSGAPGCGKSSPFKQFLQQHREFVDNVCWFAVLPRRAIMEDWKQSVRLGSESWLINTHELGLRRQAPVMVVDEVSLLPPGMVDLYLTLRPTITHVILLGDPVQCRYHNPNEESLLSTLTPEVDLWLRHDVPYQFWTHRSPGVIARALGIPTSNPEPGQIVVRQTASRQYPLICFTDSEVKNARRYQLDARTVSAHQGNTMAVAQLMVHSTMLHHCRSGDILTAATRVTHKLILVLQLHPTELAQTPKQPVLHALLHPDSPLDFLEHFRKELSGYRIQKPDMAWLDGLRASRAARSRASGQFYDRAPAQLAVHLTHMPILQPVNLKPKEPPLDRTLPRTHLPRADPNGVLDAAAQLRPREMRELLSHQGMSSLFEERAGSFVELTSALFPHQKAGDSVLFHATVAKRLKRGSAEANEADYHAKALQSALLFDALLTILELPHDPQPFDPELFSECVHEAEFVKLTKKTRAALENNVSRSDPDWKLHYVQHFIKSQLKAKEETLGIDGKAGQTLATCHDLVVLMYGPVFRYLRRKLMDAAPPNIFINCGKNVAEYGEWARQHWRPGKLCTASDYTGFDTMQKGDSLGLDYAPMRWAGLDEAWCLAFELHRPALRTLPLGYLDWKLNITSNLIGPKQLGRDTGEPGTFDDNTYFGLALYQLQYAPPRGLPACFGGDDMAANDDLQYCSWWRKCGHLFEVVAKIEHSLRPQFCGYYITDRGVYRNPRLLMIKTLWHLDKGDADSVDVNYASEAATCYEFGDALADYASWEDLEALGWLLEYYHQRRPAIARHFFSAGGGRLPDTDLPDPLADFQLEDALPRGRALTRARGLNWLALRRAAVSLLN
jgi:hypothetical protein